MGGQYETGALLVGLGAVLRVFLDETATFLINQ
jgi:hypothetical protein